MSSSDLTINIAHIEPRSNIYGPGERFVIWVQGCKIRCKGCWNEEMWSFENKNLISVKQLIEIIVAEKGIDGITVLGGEPLNQSKPLFNLCKKIKSLGLSIFLYTGYEIEEIKDRWSKKLIKLSDILVSGPFIEEQSSLDLKWRGSSNQSFNVHNENYKNLIELVNEQNEIEIHLKQSGEIILLGYPSDEIKDVIKI